MLWRLALRNLVRHRRRTLLTSIAIAVGIAVYILLTSLLGGIEEDSLRNMVRLESGALSVQSPGYWQERRDLPVDRTLPEAARLAKALAKTPGIRGASPRLTFSANLNNGTDELPVAAIGLDPRSDGSVFGLRDVVKQGRYLVPGEHAAMLGASLAELMDLKLGDQFTLVLRTQRASFEAIDLTVGAILNSSNPNVNNTNVYLPLDVAQQAARLPGRATDIVLSVPGGYQSAAAVVPAVAKTLRTEGVRAEIRTWQDAGADLLEMIKAKSASSGMILLIVVVVAAIGIINSIVLATIERTREIGTLKALGMRERDIVFLFMLEGTGLGVLGGAIGCLFGGLGALYLTIVGIDYSRFTKGVNLGIAIDGIYRGSWSWGVLVTAFLTGVVASFVISYWPARLAARLNPTTALHS